MARPKKYDKIDVKQFEDLCAIQCTKLEICSWFNIDDKTLDLFCKDVYNLDFSDIFQLKRGKGLISLRRKQFQMAQSNPTMNIWLSKQFLKQKENPDIEETSEHQGVYIIEK